MEQIKSGLLGHIKYPDDLRRLSVDQLPEVCRELREDIVEELSVNPGHLASSLGVAEITVALHYVYDTPYDRIVWDVGHQAYGHKILTGRREQFSTNRKLHGIMPFPSPAESEYDSFVCGHASNSISAALGMAVAEERFAGSEECGVRSENSGIKDGNEAPENSKDISPSSLLPPPSSNTPPSSKKKRHIVAVIGDGAMSGGLAFEGLNNVSSTPNDMLIILNDNNMSIDRSVGGMKQYLLELNTNETYNALRFRAGNWLRSKGFLADDRRNGLIRLGNALKSAISHQQNIFEGLNIRYFGPFDGHNVKELVRILRQLKDMKGPKLLHLHTTKGKGYEPAEKAATIWHAPGKFDPATGQRIKSEKPGMPPKYQDVFGHTLLELARQNPRIVGVTPAMPTGCSMNIMMEAMPDRTFDVGIAEGHAVTFSGGMAKDGLLPFCNIYSAFAQRAYDNIIHDVAILRLPVVICLDRAGLVGEDGATHHGVFDLAYLRPIPNLTIASPLNELDLRNLMYTGYKEATGTFVIRYPRGKGEKKDWRNEMHVLPIGKGKKLSEGDDIAVLSIGPIGNDVIKAIEEVAGEGISVAHYDMIYLKPIDEELLDEIGKKFKRVITVENGVAKGGLGSAVLEFMADNGYTPRVKRIGIPDTFIEHGSIPELYKLCGLDAGSIAGEIRKMMND